MSSCPNPSVLLLLFLLAHHHLPSCEARISAAAAGGVHSVLKGQKGYGHGDGGPRDPFMEIVLPAVLGTIAVVLIAGLVGYYFYLR